MKNELMQTEKGFMIPQTDGELMNVMQEELEGLTLTLDKVKIPSGGGLSFEVPGDDPESPDSVKEIHGVIIDHYPMYAYWKTKYNGQNEAPDCFSPDAARGYGYPDGDCASCPYNQFGSGEDGSKLCKNAHRLYLLRSGELYPVMITIPPTSLRALTDYLGKRIVTKGLRSYGVVTKLSLKKAVSGKGIAYSQVQFALAERLAPEMAEVMRQYGEQMRPVTRKIELQDWNADADQASDSVLPMVDMETGEVMEPLK